ncbi:transmembrane and coiled-coil domain-containing protein 4-like [Mangifera indica]|uniref:transmembrane and coiled-coil domain-containing protein 4-like n=1 Tax=Mangifera indica TaxID=29780 RepID=UPI001CFAAAB1|nr:transmembrane and coiled-coil domain-containing protein 4-like [Mangifera indica]
MATTSFLSPTQRYAAGALFAIALHQAQCHQSLQLGVPTEEDSSEDRTSCSSSSDSVSEDPELWVHENSGLLRPVFSFLEIDSAAWLGLEESAGSCPAQNLVGAFLKLLSLESDDSPSQSLDQELALAKAVDVTACSLETNLEYSKSKKERHQEYEIECHEKFSTAELQSHSELVNVCMATVQDTESNMSEGAPCVSGSIIDERPIEEVTNLSYQRKVTVLYELLSACLADAPEDCKKINRRRKGYDARHRVTLRLLAAWFDINWIKMEAVEMLVACSAMAMRKTEESKEEEAKSPKSKWAKWKRGGIIGAAALAGGTLMAITGGLAAPAIAAGFGALAPTLGTLIPVIGASGFAAVASAAGTVAGSVAVAASFGAAGAGLTGSKMARRTGSVDEFEFKPLGESSNQGRLAVEILISGLVFNEKDFIRPWEGKIDNLERYALQWESKTLIAVSTAIQDWLTSSITLGLMKQGAMMTVLNSLLVALAWPATLVLAADLIDSKWTIAVNRSDKAGRLLAEVLLKGLQGNRPVTLIGYSLGARVIFKCLEHLAKTECTAGIVERVVLLGAPISIKNQNWEAVRKMVAGRFVNAYSTNDWMLGVAFRASLLSQGLAGIQPINIPGIENVDVTHLVEGHSSYLWATQQILDRLELDTCYPVFRNDLDKK